MNQGIIARNEKQVIELIDQGVSAYKVGKIIGCSRTAILNFLSKNGLKSKVPCKVDKNNVLKDKVDTVIKLFNEGKNASEIGRILGFTHGHICKILHDNNIETPQTIYNVDEHFFDKIDTEIKAYVLGWFYSDGCVDLKGHMRIGLQSNDAHILERIKLEMKYDGPLYFEERHEKFPNLKSVTYLSIYRKSLANKLIELGCVPNKSLIITFPDNSIVPDYLLSHFIRGVFDGDGSIDKHRYKTSITTTDLFNNALVNLLQTLGIYSKIYYRTEGKNTCSLLINRRKDSKAFLDWIYKDATIFLDRKHKLYLEFCDKIESGV